MLPDAPFLLFDDARPGGAPARLYHAPAATIEAWTLGEVVGALEKVRAALADGRHVAGFLSYEAGAALERSVPDGTRTTPLAWFGVFDGFAGVADVPALLPDPAGAWIGAPTPEIDRDAYDAMFARVQALIAAGDIYQANLTFRAHVPFAGACAAVYARLRAEAAAGWGALIDTGADSLLSLSPELFFRLEAGRLECRPMKGTARRGGSRSADRAAAEGLAGDAKQRAENLMIVDLMRNDLARVAVAGSVAVPALFAVETYPSLHQMTSTVTAALAEGCDAVDVLAALFPCGSITGAPKVRAMQVLAEVEQGSPRGPYTGAIGWFAPDGDAQFNVAIRTLLVPGGQARALMGLGGGIVADSRAGDEWDEALAKGGFVAAASHRVDLIETMAFDPEDGIVLLERHLARIRASAEALGVGFDRHAARNELQAATFRLRVPARVRLVVAASGAVAIETGPMPEPRAMNVAVVPLPVDPGDYRLRHKTTNRGFYDAARAQAGTDEVVFEDPHGFLTEGSFTSLFVERDGMLVTPPLARGLLPGVLRAELIETGRAVEGDLRRDDLAGGFCVGNAVRGLLQATLAG